MRLTDAERRRIEGELDSARAVAAGYRTRLLSFPERLSAAYLGLCLAARRWERRAPFHAYARARMIGQIARDVQVRHRRMLREYAIRDEEIDSLAVPARGDEGGSIPLADALAGLPPFEREVILCRSRGQSYREVCVATGRRSPNGVQKAERRALARLRSLLDA